MDGREAHFGLFGERIVFKNAADKIIHYGSVCSYNEKFSNL
jgi:hypothetical protein